MRANLAAWLRTVVVATALTAFALAWFDVLPHQVPPAWRAPIALLAAAAVMGAGLDLLVSAVKGYRRAR